MLLHHRWIVASRYSGRFDFRGVMDALGGPDRFESATAVQLKKAGLTGRLWEQLCSSSISSECSSVDAVRMGDRGYPQQLLDLPKAPPVIWFRGDLSLLSVRGLAVVGSRACTSYGTGIAESIGRMEAMIGGVLVSGGARGIDIAAHRGALDMGRTAVVLGAGLQARSSMFRSRLYAEVVENGGVLISEFAPNTPPNKWSFPQRNRVIAALARAVVIVEAAQRSGALITAEFARFLGRDVFAVPGPIGAPASEGCNLLIQDGCPILLQRRDAIWESRGDRLPNFPPLLLLLRSGPKSLADLQSRLKMDPHRLARTVSRFEIVGLVCRKPGGLIALA